MKLFGRRALGLLPIPLVVLVATLTTLQKRGPFWLGTNSDPSYSYVLNSLRLLEGRPPSHLDHPGLTTQLFGAAAFPIGHVLASRPRPLVEDVLAHAEWYLGAAVRAFLVLFAASLAILGRAVLRATNRWGLVWVAQAGPLLSPSALFELTDFKPEPFLYLWAALLAASICAAVAGAWPEGPMRAATFGVLVGLAVASKLTALSLLLCPLILLRTRRARVICWLSAGAAFLLCALPALPNWRSAAAFAWRVASGPGLYGESRFAAERPYGGQWARIAIEEAPFFVVLLIGLAVSARAWPQRARPEVAPALRALAALLATCLAQLALVAIHPYQPRYLLPALGLSGLVLALSLQTLGLAAAGGPGRPMAVSAAVVIAALLGLQLSRFVRREAELTAATRCQMQVRAHAESSGCRIVTYYRGSSPALALFQGDAWAGGSFRERLRRLFPDEAFLRADGGLEGFAGPVDLEGPARRCLVLHGSPGGPGRPFSATTARAFEGLEDLSSVRPVFSCGWEAAFRRD